MSLSQPFAVAVDLMTNELQNAVIQNLAAFPMNPKPGLIYYDTTSNTAYVYEAGSTNAWIPWDARLATNIPNTALATNPLLRSNHIGTQTASTISDLSTVVHAYTLDSFAAPVAPVSFAAQRATNLADPTNPQDAATKNYVDTVTQSAVAGIDSKPAVQVVATANQSSLSGLPTIDGITLTAGQRVLLVGQTNQAQNGPYVVGSGAWSRPSGDSSPNGELSLGSFWYVEQGSQYASSQWRLATPTSGSITPNTTAVTITQFGQATSIFTATNGVQLVGSVVSAQTQVGGGILAPAAGLAVDTTIIVRKYAQVIGDGTTTAFAITHNLGNATPVVAVKVTGTGTYVITSVVANSANQVTVSFALAPSSNQYTVEVLG